VVEEVGCDAMVGFTFTTTVIASRILDKEYEEGIVEKKGHRSSS
jgi:hypothetical protein